MVKNRKPIFVSEVAHNLLLERSEHNKCFIGDEIDILLGLRNREEVVEENKIYFKEVAPELATN